MITAPAAIIEMDIERDRKTCVTLDLKVTGANRELAQWLLDHQKYSGTLVAEWLGCSDTRVRALRRWAENGFQGAPFYDERRQGRNRQRDADDELESLDNLETDDETAEVSDEIAEPAVIEDNVIYTIQRMNEHARVFKALFKKSTFDRESGERIGAAIEQMIEKWRSTQAILTRRNRDGYDLPSR